MPGSSFYLFLKSPELRDWLLGADPQKGLRFWPEVGPLNEEVRCLDAETFVESCFGHPKNLRPRFLIATNDQPPVTSLIQMKDGSGWKVGADPISNPEFAVILPGSDLGDQGLVSSMVSCANESENAKRLFSALKKSAQKISKFVSGFYVSESVYKLHLEGMRLFTHSGEEVRLKH